MEYINKVINIIGLKMLIAIVSIVLIVIVLFITYRLLKLKHYRKQIVDLENRINAIKSLPLQYRLGRVKGIAKNMPELQDKYELYEEQFSKLSDTLNDEITPLINEVDEALYYRKLHGVQKKMSKLENDVMHYETDSKQLLKDIEVITEIENIQRLEIIKVKEKYRETNDHYSQIRFKVEDYVPKLQDVFHDIDQQFVQLEDYMNNQQFEEAKQYTEKVSKDIDDLEANLRDLPTYISVTRQYLPKRLNELKTIMDEMMQKDFAVERMKAPLRIDKIESDLNETAQAIKDLNLENVGQNIEVMTEDMNLLYADFEKEQNAYALYEEKRDACYKYVNTIDSGLSKTRDVIKDLEKNYILSDYEITIEDDYKEFQKVLDDLNDVTEIIESKDFSYQDMIGNFERITVNSKPFNDSLIKHNELAESLKIQEKRALDELDNINIVLLEIKSEIRNKHLPMISESYQDYIDDSYQYVIQTDINMLVRIEKREENDIVEKEVTSNIYSYDDITSAINTVIDYFNENFKGCTLKEIYYAGDNENYFKEILQQYGGDEAIVLISTFDVDGSGGDGSLNPNSTYKDWIWLLVRNKQGEWKHVDHGY